METVPTGKLNNGFSASTEQCEYMFVVGQVFHFDSSRCMHLIHALPIGF